MPNRDDLVRQDWVRQDRARQAAERAARESYGRLVALLARRTSDVAAAEDALGDAFAAALATWPVSGVPQSPDAWLMAVAQRRHLDSVRRAKTAAAAGPDVSLLAGTLAAATADGPAIQDERLGLMFACAHPAIEDSVRAPLILQAVLGFNAAEIASAFLVAPGAMGQRLVRAKAKIKGAGIAFRVPDRDELADRLDAVLDAIYAAYAVGWSDATGSDTRDLAREAIWLGRIIVSLLPNEPEAAGLLALMLHAEARRAARRDAQGGFVPLAAQDTTRWDTALIDEAEALLRQAATKHLIGGFQLEAAAQSVHAARRTTGMTDWEALVGIYDGLLALTGSPVVKINRAVALGAWRGADAGLTALGDASVDKRLDDYQPYWATRAELLAKTGDADAARAAYGRAIGLATDPAVRAFLLQQRDALA